MKKKRSASNPPALPRVALSFPHLGKAWRILAYFFAILQPGPAFVLGMLYASQKDPKAKRFGFLCLVIACAGFFLHFLMGHHFESMDGGEAFLQPFD